jgi:hypothetical protein
MKKIVTVKIQESDGEIKILNKDFAGKKDAA